MGADQHSILVHHDPNERENSNTAHDDSERQIHDQQPKVHADGRQGDRPQNHQNAIETIELGNQDDRHEEQRDAERLGDKILGVFLLLVLIVILTAHSGPGAIEETRGHHIALDLAAKLVRLNTRFDIRLDQRRSQTVDPADRPATGLRLELGETAKRHAPPFGFNAQRRQLLHVPKPLGIAQHDVNLLVDANSPVLRQFQSFSHQADELANPFNVGAIFHRLGSIDLYPPFDARNRQRVFNIANIIKALQETSNFAHRRPYAIMPLG